MKSIYYNGKTISEWAQETGIKRSTLANRIKEGWPIEDAISVPYGERRKKSASLHRIAVENKMSHKTLKKRIEKGMSIEEALVYTPKQNLIGQKYGRLYVVEEVEAKRDPNGKTRRRYRCKCNCGKCVDVLAETLKSGSTQSCGCLAVELSKKRNSKNIEGKTSGYLTAIKPVYSDKQGVHWLCQCKCGNQTVVTTNNFLMKHIQSCGCYNLEALTARRKAELTGRRFGNVVALECVGQNQFKNYLWRCLCDCGNEFTVPASRLITGETQSCGCVHSRAEQFIAKYFKEREIVFERNAHFNDLKYKGVLFFDFMIWDKQKNPYLIEFQGIQHYVAFPNGFGNLQRLITDPMKREYCRKNDIPLYEIRYDEPLQNKLEEIIAYVNPVLSSDL